MFSSNLEFSEFIISNLERYRLYHKGLLKHQTDIYFHLYILSLKSDIWSIPCLNQLIYIFCHLFKLLLNQIGQQTI